MAATQTNYNNKVEIFQRNTHELFCAIYDSSDNLMDINGYTADLYARRYGDETIGDPDISVSGTLVDASNGAVLFPFSTTDTSVAVDDYTYEVIITGSGNQITVLQDRLSILNSVKY